MGRRGEDTKVTLDMSEEQLRKLVVPIAKIFAEELARALQSYLGGEGRAHSESKTPRLIPLAKWNEFHPYPSVHSLRWMVFRSYYNGIDECLVRVGRRILINEEKFFEWLESGKANLNVTEQKR